MKVFTLDTARIDPQVQRRHLDHPSAGACVSFEGWVRDHNDGKAVLRLDYQAYGALAEHEGQAVLAEAMRRFPIRAARCVHRVGPLEIGDLAVWVGVSADHRGAAFEACHWIIDEVKRRVPIWKNEHYADGQSGWLHPDGSAVATAGAG
ncbi:molybdenum cofactor biosynthesis protein MoaE [Dokdonella koreensis]|uniref:Molybdopterin synthase catalytic subunit n=1 Tax=Dokdonella koreensis DS-123 TaxID=1300342 RepID=A0A160DUX5_9GAMM|nr:Molybdenum cofactor biosynthesis protein MoaE [Dokdonella koreensis DS-123]